MRGGAIVHFASGQLSKEEYARKESIMVIWCKLKIPSLG